MAVQGGRSDYDCIVVHPVFAAAHASMAIGLERDHTAGDDVSRNCAECLVDYLRRGSG